MKLIAIKELSDFLKIKQSTLYSWASSGMIPSYKLNGVLRFDKDEIEEWVKKNKVEPLTPQVKIRKRENSDIDNIVWRAINGVTRKGKRE